MTEKPNKPEEASVLRVCITHDNPIESRVLGDILLAFSNEFTLFLAKNSQKYREHENLTLCIKEVKKGSEIVDFFINAITTLNALDIQTINIALQSFFDFIKRSRFINKLALLLLTANRLNNNMQINFELFNSNNTLIENNQFTLTDSEAKKNLSENLEEQLEALDYEFTQLKNTMVLLDRKQNIINELYAERKKTNVENDNDQKKDS